MNGDSGGEFSFQVADFTYHHIDSKSLYIYRIYVRGSVFGLSKLSKGLVISNFSFAKVYTREIVIFRSFAKAYTREIFRNFWKIKTKAFFKNGVS